MHPSTQVSMVSDASSLVNHKCTRLPKYRCSRRPRPWLDTSAPVYPSIHALRGLVPGYAKRHPSPQLSMLSEALSLVRHMCTRLPKYRCSRGLLPGYTLVHPSTKVSMFSDASSLVKHKCTRLPNYQCSRRLRPWLDTSAPVYPSIDALRGLVPG